jgi:hypothetical protein
MGQALTVRRFRLGILTLTRSVNDLTADYSAFAKFVWECLKRHQHNDWGDLDAEDKASNDRDVSRGGRLLSAYTLPPAIKRILTETSDSTDVRLWIITEGDRSATTVLWPSEY